MPVSRTYQFPVWNWKAPRDPAERRVGVFACRQWICGCVVDHHQWQQRPVAIWQFWVVLAEAAEDPSPNGLTEQQLEKMEEASDWKVRDWSTKKRRRKRACTETEREPVAVWHRLVDAAVESNGIAMPDRQAMQFHSQLTRVGGDAVRLLSSSTIPAG